jgi:hypothetical protein
VFAVSIGYGALRVVGGCEPFGAPAALSNAQGEWAPRLCAVWVMHALGASVCRDGPSDQPGSFAPGVDRREPVFQSRNIGMHVDIIAAAS